MRRSADGPPRRTRRGVTDFQIKLITLAGLLLLWEALSRLGYISPLVLPRPTRLATQNRIAAVKPSARKALRASPRCPA